MTPYCPFANSWCTGDRYILIGVKEKTPGPAEVQGITEHIDDASIQQFVNSKTNRPVKFSYFTEKCEEKTIGVIKIYPNDRPVYLNKAYGGLQANIVYVRRGSSSDEAVPDEVAKMSNHDATFKNKPSFEIGFYNSKNDTKSGSNIDVEINYDNTLPIIDNLPDYLGDNNYKEKSKLPLFNYLQNEKKPNLNYIREYLNHFTYLRKLIPLQFYIKNLSEILAVNVKASLEIDINELYKIVHIEDIPSQPDQYKEISPLYNLPDHLFNSQISSISIRKFKNKHVVNIDFGNIQPMETKTVDERINFYLKSLEVKKIDINLTISGDNVSIPITNKMSVVTTVKNVDFEWKQWMNSLEGVDSVD